jgi:hypothetical protein
MEIFLRGKAEMVFRSQNIPVNSLGVFQANDEEWIYWYSDGRIFDSGSSPSEPKAMQEAKKYIKLIDFSHEKELSVFRNKVDDVLSEFWFLKNSGNGQ